MPRATSDLTRPGACPAPSRRPRAGARPPADTSRPGPRAAGLGALGLSLWLAGCVQLDLPPSPQASAHDEDGARFSQAEADCGMPDLPRQALAKLNDYRAAGARCGTAGRFSDSPPLRWQPQLARAAAAHLDEQVPLGRLSHTSADGRALTQRLEATGYPWQAAAENLAAGQSRLDWLLLDWMRSPAHCANLMSPDYQDAALACRRAEDGRLYWALVLGRARAPAPASGRPGAAPAVTAPAASASRGPTDPLP